MVEVTAELETGRHAEHTRTRARCAAHLPRRCSRRRQDVRHAQRGPAPPRAGHRRRRRLRRDPRPGAHRRADRGPRGHPAAHARAPRHDVRGDGRRRHPAASTGVGARRRVRPHQRARLAERQALAGHRRAARCRHRRHLDGQHPAPRVAQRRRRADHRHQAARDGARPGRPPGRPDRARRHGPRGAAPADGARQHLRRRQGRRGARQLLPSRQPVGVARAGPAVGRRPGRRLAGRVPRASRHHQAVGDTRARRRRPVRRAGRLPADPPSGADRPAGQR